MCKGVSYLHPRACVCVYMRVYLRLCACCRFSSFSSWNVLFVLDKENQWSPHGGFSPSPIKEVDTSAFLPVCFFIVYTMM